MALGRRTWIIGGVAAGALVTFGILIAAAHIPLSSERLRKKVEASLAEQLASEVELQSLTLRLLPEPSVVGTGLFIRHKGRTDVPPLISVRRFTVHTGLLALAHGHIARVALEGLELEIPPPPLRTPAEELRDDEEQHQARLAALEQRAAARAVLRKESGFRQMVIDSVVADDARMAVISRDPDTRPKVWAMHQLRLHDVTVDKPMPFHTLLTNGVPPGEFDAAGTFGPWDTDEPEETPLGGTFTFAHGDLSVFQGISGIVSMTGTFGGTLGTIRAAGETDTPDFTIALANHPIHLKARYRALVNATNGDTMIEELDATFLNTSLVAKGGVYDVRGASGRLVRVDIVMDKGRLEDVMRLAINTPTAPMTGELRLHTKLELPPGDRDIVEKLRLEGSFAIRRGRFTDRGVQKKLGELSQRASGRMKDAPPDASEVRSDFTGQFTLANGTLRVPRVTFNVPGALVDVSGQFMLRPPQAIAFGGNLYADAKVSEMTTGWKSLLLKVVDPLFRHDGRTVVPLKITGTRSDPSFGVDVKHVLSHGSD